MFRQRTHYVLIAGLVSLLAAPAFAADVQYSTPLDPVAFDNSTVKNNVGTGEITATLSGKTLTVTGKYSGLSSAATKAEVKIGPVMGVPGPVVGELKIPGGMSGDISGSITLTSAQLASLNKGGVSVVINSEKAPNGNLWGWLQTAAQ